jgi:lipopolysaccharide export system permease protein
VLIFRYLAKEVFITLVSLTTILLLIFMSNQFVQYLTRAANGEIPAMFIVKLMMLELPNLMGLLLPLGFYVSLLLAYGRLYADSEMTVLHACGYGQRDLLKQSLIMAAFVAIVVAIIVLWGGPKIAIERTKLLRTTGVQMLIKTIAPQRFRALPGGRDVFYVEAMNRDHSAAHGLFLARLISKNDREQWHIIWARQAYLQADSQVNSDYLVLKSGKSYLGTPGQADYQVALFDQLDLRLPAPDFTFKSGDLRTTMTRDLWPLNNPDRTKEAELQWRISIPLMVIVLTLIAVPLSRVNPRMGKYANLLPAIVIFFVYANFIFIVRGWILADKIPTWLGLWSLHGVFAGLGGLLLWHNRSRFQ